MNSQESQNRLPLSQVIIYSSGYFGIALISFSIGTLPQIFYVPEDGASLVQSVAIGGAMILGGYLYGLLNGLGRVVDAITDPWIGNISDHLRTRFGRRKPLIIIGTPLMGICFVLFTTPPTSEASYLNLLWLAVIYPLFFVFYTIAVLPYLAMIPEITRTPSERLLVTTLQSVFLILGTFTAVFIIGEIPHRLSFFHAATLSAILTCIPLMISAWLTRIPDELHKEEIAERPSTMSQVRDALEFTPFRIFLYSIVAFYFGFEMVKNSGRYIATILFQDVGAYTVILGLALGVAALAGVGAYWLGKKIGKRKSMIVMSSAFVILMPLTGLIGLGPFQSKIFGYILFALMGLPISLLLIVPNSLLADIIDINNEKSGKKREALFFASQALLNKVGIAFSKMAMNFLLPIGAVISSEGVREATGELGVRLIGPVASIFVLIGLLIFLKFPDIEKRNKA